MASSAVSPAFAGIIRIMHDVTAILSAIEQGDAHAAGRLLPLVYDELRKVAAQRMAQELPGQTLQPTALVHGGPGRRLAPVAPKAFVWLTRRGREASV